MSDYNSVNRFVNVTVVYHREYKKIDILNAFFHFATDHRHVFCEGLICDKSRSEFCIACSKFVFKKRKMFSQLERA